MAIGPGTEVEIDLFIAEIKKPFIKNSRSFGACDAIQLASGVPAAASSATTIPGVAGSGTPLGEFRLNVPEPPK